MKLNINENKYNVKKRQVGTETLAWYDDEGFYRIKYFCNKDYRLARMLLIETKRKAFD